MGHPSGNRTLSSGSSCVRRQLEVDTMAWPALLPHRYRFFHFNNSSLLLPLELNNHQCYLFPSCDGYAFHRHVNQKDSESGYRSNWKKRFWILIMIPKNDTLASPFFFLIDFSFSFQKTQKFVKDVMCTCIARDFSAGSWDIGCLSTSQEKVIRNLFQHDFCKLLLKGKPGIRHPKTVLPFWLKGRRKVNSTMCKLLPASCTSFIQSFEAGNVLPESRWDCPKPSGRSNWEGISDEKPGADGPSIHAVRHNRTQDLSQAIVSERAACCLSHLLLVLLCFFPACSLGWRGWGEGVWQYLGHSVFQAALIFTFKLLFKNVKGMLKVALV